MNPKTLSCGLAALVLLAVPFGTARAAGPGHAPKIGALYTMTNAIDGNEVLTYERLPNGMVRPGDALPTGGLGTGTGLGNQGGVALSDDGRWLLVVNAGSDELSVFDVRHSGLALTDVVASGGSTPISVAIDRDLVYVVNAGSDDISGFRLAPDGSLTPVPGSTRPLSGAGVAPAQVAFAPGGGFLLVTEKATSVIDTYAIDEEGLADGPIVNDAAGMTPFALDFSSHDHVIVSEVSGGAPEAGTVSSYRLTPEGDLEVLDGAVPNFQTAPCWLVVTRSGRHAYTTNTPDDSLSAYAVGRDGDLVLMDADGSAAEPGMGTRPLDMALSRDGRFVYTLNIGDDTIGIFRIEPGGSLQHLGNHENVPDGANGLAAW